MRSPLHVVTPADERPDETVAERIRALQAEAKRLAVDESHRMSDALRAIHAQAAEIHAGGEAFAPGVRGVARDVMQHCESALQTLQAIIGRMP